MYDRRVIPFVPRKRGLAGLGAGSDLLTAAADLYTGGAYSAATGAGGSGGAAMPSNTTVSPQLSTQISPQISPVFQQQFQPTNSAQSAGTAQSLPGMPSLSNGGGVGTNPTTMMPSSLPNYGYNNAVPQVPQVQTSATSYTQYIPWVIGGLVAIMAIKAYKGKSAQK